MNVIVVGGGVVGVSTAYLLGRRGHQVRVLEAADGVGTGCSFANGGQLSYCYAEPLASPALLRQLPGLLWRNDSTLTFRVRELPRLLKWGLQFLRHCNAEHAAVTTENVLRLALYSRQVLHAVQSRENLEFPYRRTGKLHVHGTRAALEAARRLCDIKNRNGCGQEVLDADQCLALEPALQAFRGRLAGGVYSPLDESADSYALTKALADAGEASGRLRFLFGERGLALETRGMRITGVRTQRRLHASDAFVLCPGAEAPVLARGIGLYLPIYPVKGYSVTLPAGQLPPIVSITDAEHRLVYSTLGDVVRIAGFMEFSGYDRSVDPKPAKRMLAFAAARVPCAADYRRPLSHWTGLRPMTPDGAPIIGKTRYQNLFLNTGHGMLGSTLAMGCAAILTDLLGGTSPGVDLTGLTLARYRKERG